MLCELFVDREVKILVREDKPAGSYKVQFDASQFSSGVFCNDSREKILSVKK